MPARRAILSILAPSYPRSVNSLMEAARMAALVRSGSRVFATRTGASASGETAARSFLDARGSAASGSGDGAGFFAAGMKLPKVRVSLIYNDSTPTGMMSPMRSYTVGHKDLSACHLGICRTPFRRGLDLVGDFLCHHDDRRVRVGPRDGWHQRGVADAQTLHSEHEPRLVRHR